MSELPIPSAEAVVEPSPTPEQKRKEARAIVEAEQVKAAQACEAEINAALKRHAMLLDTRPEVGIGPNGVLSVRSGPVRLIPDPEAWR